MAESTIPKPKSETAPEHSNSHKPESQSVIFEIFGNVGDLCCYCMMEKIAEEAS